MGFLSSVTSLVKNIIPKVLPLVAAAIGGPGLAKIVDLFTQVAGGLLNKSGSGGLFSSTVPLSLPNPLSALNGLASSLGGQFTNTGDFLSRIGGILSGNRNVGGQEITIPTFAQRAKAATTYTQQTSSSQSASTQGSQASQGSTKSGSAVTSLSQVGNMPLFTADEEKDMKGLKPEDKAMMTLQRKAQRYNQMLQLFTNLMQMDHEAKMAVIRNVRA